MAAVNRSVLFGALIAGAVAVIITLVMSHRIVQPVESLTSAARQMEKGDLTARVKVTSSDEIGQLAHAFNAMADGLARQEQLRRNMVSDVAHELRTPLTNIRGYLEAAKDGVVQPDAAWWITCTKRPCCSTGWSTTCRNSRWPRPANCAWNASP